MLAPFRHRSFRFQWPADLLTSWAIEMEVLILGWYILVETRSVVLLTLFGALQYFGSLFSPLFGVASDRIGHRTVLVMMRAVYTLLSLTLMGLAFAGLLTPVLVFVIAILGGLVRPSDLAMRSALIGQTMPTGELAGAMGISRTTSDSARIAGSIAGAGLVAWLGIGPAYVVVSAFYLAGLALTFGVTIGRRGSSADANRVATSPWRDLVEGLGYVWRTPRLLALMWLAFLVNLTAFPLSNGLLPFVARDIYGIQQTGLGYLVASFATGALIGSLILSFLRGGFRLERVVLIAAFAWYAVLLGFAQMTTPLAGGAMLLLAGLAQSLSMVSMAVSILHTSEPHLRGRVMGVRMLAIYSLPIGLLAAGLLIERLGFHATATLYASIGIVLTALIGIYWRAALWQTTT